MDRAQLIEVDPEKMSGAPCFTGTRVPVTHLFDYLCQKVIKTLETIRPGDCVVVERLSIVT